MYVAEKTVTTPCSIAHGRSGLKLPPSRSGSGTISRRGPIRQFPRHAAPRLRSRHHPFRSANNYALLTDRRKRLRPDSKKRLSSYRDELIIFDQGGLDMWPGPYGIEAREYMLASLDQA